MKKCIAVLLTFCMLLTALPVFAASDAAKQTLVNETFDGEIIVSHTDAEKTGEWNGATSLLNYDGTRTAYASSDASVTFTPAGLKKGNYEVFYWIPLHKQNGPQQNFVVNHNGKATETFIYTKLDDGEEPVSGWISLGVFDFAGTGTENLYMEAKGPNYRASAAKFVPTTKATAYVEVESPKEETKEEPKEEAKEEPKKEVAVKLADSIDAEPGGFCEYVGGWKYSGSLTGPMTKAPYSLWAAGANSETYVNYYPYVLADCNVRVSVYLLYWSGGQTTDVKYEVHHNGKVDEFHVDLTSISESQWLTLGTFDFGGNNEDYVHLECTGAGTETTNTRASTIAFEILNDSATDPNGADAVWQTIYVTPERDSEAVYATQKDILATMDKFSDMKDHWANYDVEYMANEGLVSGVAEGIFDPEAQITRAEYVTILDRALGFEIASGESYADIASDAWYAPYVATAKANGLLNGLPTDDGFKPEQPITRQEMALFTYNAIQKIGKNDEWVKTLPDGWSAFTDTASVSDWATDALKYLIQTGIIKGTSDTTVSPMDNATRAQGAVILKRFMQMFVWAGPPTDEEWVMTFNDEFLGDSVNWDVWISGQYGPGGSVQSARGPDNAVVKDGNLYMMTKKEKKADKEWTTAHMWVSPTVFRQAYGYFEARYKICESTGINNAFWLMTSPALVSDSTQNFELDINEGHYPNEVCATYHEYSTGERIAYSKSYRSAYNLALDYHTYALEWNPDELIYYCDGMEIARHKNINAHIALFPYLSSAVLSWAGTVKDDADGTAQIVDYVRVWQRPQDKDKTFINQPTSRAQFDGPVTVRVADQQVDNTTYPNEIIVHYETVGTDWKTSSTIRNYDGNPHMFTLNKEDYAMFKLDGIQAGKYKVYYWRLPHTANKKQENVLLIKADGKEEVFGSVALIPDEGTQAEAGWVELGEAELTAKDAFCIKGQTGVSTRASGIKLVPIQ